MEEDEEQEEDELSGDDDLSWKVRWPSTSLNHLVITKLAFIFLPVLFSLL